MRHEILKVVETHNRVNDAPADLECICNGMNPPRLKCKVRKELGACVDAGMLEADPSNPDRFWITDKGGDELWKTARKPPASAMVQHATIFGQ